MIYHVTSATAWQEALVLGRYEAPSLAMEGFIHSSTMPQVQGVLDRYYKNESHLVLLHINEAKLQPDMRYELSPSLNEFFPHIFGPINLSAVETVEIIR